MLDKSFRLVLAAFIAAFSLSPSSAQAGARRFTFLYEATTTPRGVVEFENSVTWQTSKPANSRFNELDFRHEIEFGITDRLQAAIYVADWFWQNDPVEHANSTRYQDSAIELIYNLTNPTTDWLGSAIYG